MLGGETDPEALYAIIIALHHQMDSCAMTHIVAFKDHSDADVRWAVAFNLGRYDNDVAIDALFALSGDPEAKVRDWATFEIGTQSDRDTDAIRNALYARVQDEDKDIQAEAVIGLANRGDERVRDPLLAALTLLSEDDSERVGTLLFEATAAIGDSRHLPRLLELKETWYGDDIDAAIARCMGKTVNDDHDS